MSEIPRPASTLHRLGTTAAAWGGLRPSIRSRMIRASVTLRVGISMPTYGTILSPLSTQLEKRRTSRFQRTKGTRPERLVSLQRLPCTAPVTWMMKR